MELGTLVVVPDSGLAYKGSVTAAAPATNQFTIPTLAGLGIGKFSGANSPFYAVVLRKNTGTSAAPQGEQKVITAYNTNTGQFTTLPFTVPIAINDEVQILSADLAANPTILSAIGVLPVTLDTGLAYKGTVTATPLPNQFTIPSLAGMGVGKFAGATAPFYAFVLRKGTGSSGAPQGQQQVVTAYDNVTGTFTAPGFTIPIAIGDDVQILSADLAANPTILSAIGVLPVTLDTGLAYKGTVTATPLPNQFTIPSLAGMGVGKFAGAINPYSAFVFRKGTGTGLAPQGEINVITAFNTGNGTFTAPGFTVPIAIRDEILIVHPSIANAVAMVGGLAAILAAIAATDLDVGTVNGIVTAILAQTTTIQTQTNKLAGVPTGMGSVSKNWQAAEQNLITIGADGVSYKLHMFNVDISALAGNITIRAYIKINGVEQRIFPIPAATTFTAAVSAPGIPLIDTTGAITEALRVTIQSDAVADNGKAVGYEYKLEAM
jgi:hypothetical protein